MKIDPDVNATQILANYTNGNKSDFYDALEDDHPGLTALVMTEGIRRRILTMSDVNVIVNNMIDRRREALRKQDANGLRIEG